MARPKRDQPTFIEQARQKQIQEIAREIFSNVGFKQTSLAEIAEVAGISKGVIIYHYGSKAELGKAVLHDILDGYGAFLREKAQQQATARASLLELPSFWASYVKQNRNPFLLYIDVLGSFGDIEEKRAFMAEANRSQREFLVELIEGCKKEGMFDTLPSGALADIIQAALDGLMEQYSVDPDEIDLKACALLLKKLLENSI